MPEKFLNMPDYVWISPKMREYGGIEPWYTILVFCFFLVKTCKEITYKLSRICKIIDIQSLSSQFYDIIIIC